MIKRGLDKMPIVPKHTAPDYIISGMKKAGWKEDKILAEKSGISTAEISRIKKGERESLSPSTFIRLVRAFGDSIEYATTAIYPDLDLTLGEYTLPKRNEFGNFMAQFEQKSVNTPEEVAAKTGIPLSRIKLIYFRTGSPEAYELLLIEKAIGKEPGSLFEGYYGRKN